MNSKEQLFRLNTNLISAFGIDSEYSKDLILENDTNYKNVSNELKNEYDLIKSGQIFALKNEKKASVQRAQQAINDYNLPKAFVEYAKLYKEYPEDNNILKILAEIMLLLNLAKPIEKYLMTDLKKIVKDDLQVKKLMATTYLKLQKLNFYRKAIPLFKDIIEKEPTYGNYLCLANCYEMGYQNIHINDAIENMKNALDISPEEFKNDALVYLAKLYCCGKYFDLSKQTIKRMDHTTLSADQKYFISFVLQQCGEIQEATKYYWYRFDAERAEYPVVLSKDKRLTSLNNLKDKTVLIHFEQGFGDTIMYCRYVQDIAKYAKKTIFIVQTALLSLIKSSGFEKYCTVYSQDIKNDVKNPSKKKGYNVSSFSTYGQELKKLEYDYHTALLEAPYLLKITKDTLGHTEGYLSPSEERIKAYKSKYIKDNNKLKIGISYHGNKEADDKYRDLAVKYLVPLFEMPNVEFYSFQTDGHSREIVKYMDKYDNIINLKNTFNDFEDTASAIKCMDLMISTDNVIMNLSGALGAKTYGVFNAFAETRWFKTKGEDIGWYSTIKPFQVKTFNDWKNLIIDIKKSIIKDFNL